MTTQILIKAMMLYWTFCKVMYYEWIHCLCESGPYFSNKETGSIRKILYNFKTKMRYNSFQNWHMNKIIKLWHFQNVYYLRIYYRKTTKRSLRSQFSMTCECYPIKTITSQSSSMFSDLLDFFCRFSYTREKLQQAVLNSACFL